MGPLHFLTDEQTNLTRAAHVSSDAAIALKVHAAWTALVAEVGG
jgi:hypothetical protein